MTERPDRRPRPVATILSMLVVALLAAAVALAFVVKSHLDARDKVAAARDNALQAGRQAILNLDALSAVTIDQDLARVVAGATGQFKSQFVAAEGDLKNLVVTRKTTSKGTILSAGVVRSDQASATVLVAVDRVVKDSTTPDGTVAHDRWKVSLELRGGRWLVANLEAVA